MYHCDMVEIFVFFIFRNMKIFKKIFVVNFGHPVRLHCPSSSLHGKSVCGCKCGNDSPQNEIVKIPYSVTLFKMIFGKKKLNVSTTFSSFINNNNIDPKAQKENNLGFLKIIIIFRLNHVPEMLSCITSVCIFEASSPPPQKKIAHGFAS